MVVKKSLNGWWKNYQTSKNYKQREKTIIKLLSNYVNRFVEKSVEDFPKQIRIRKKALLKGNNLAKKIIRLSKSPCELFLYAISDKENDEIIDLGLPDKQRVGETYCEALTSENLEKKLVKEGKRIVGWTHSHAYFDTFHSKTDYETTRELTSVYGIKNDFKLGVNSEFKVGIKYFLSIVINAKNSYPDSAIGVVYPHYGTEGKISKYCFSLKKASLEIT